MRPLSTAAGETGQGETTRLEAVLRRTPMTILIDLGTWLLSALTAGVYVMLAGIAAIVLFGFAYALFAALF